MTPLIFRLMPGDIARLAPHLRQCDLDDIKDSSMHPLAVLSFGMNSGRAWGIHWGREVIGAGGYSAEGTIWSLWADLTPEQSRAIMKETPRWARLIRKSAGEDAWLWNVYLKGNHQTEAYLRASHCVNIDKENSILHDGREFIPFHLKTAEELARV